MGDTQLFLVRLWQDGAQFRAAVRAADDELPVLFTAPQQLADFLQSAAARGRSAGPASAPDPSRRPT